MIYVRIHSIGNSVLIDINSRDIDMNNARRLHFPSQISVLPTLFLHFSFPLLSPSFQRLPLPFLFLFLHYLTSDKSSPSSALCSYFHSMFLFFSLFLHFHSLLLPPSLPLVHYLLSLHLFSPPLLLPPLLLSLSIFHSPSIIILYPPFLHSPLPLPFLRLIQMTPNNAGHILSCHV